MRFCLSILLAVVNGQNTLFTPKTKMHVLFCFSQDMLKL